MTYKISISHSDLQAYVDGELTVTRAREVEAYLASHPEEAAIVAEYRQLNQAVHELYDPVMEEPIPAQLAIKRSDRPIWRIAAMLAWLGIGIVIGGVFLPMDNKREQTLSQSTFNIDLIQPAAFAHAIYSPEIRHPVEVSASEQNHLLAWLSKRLKYDIKAPDLSTHGYSLIGGRLLPSTNRMAAQLMYQRGDGNRITLYMRHGVWDNHSTSFQFAQQNDIGVFYWIDGSVGFALSGRINKSELLELSNTIYQQMG